MCEEARAQLSMFPISNECEINSNAMLSNMSMNLYYQMCANLDKNKLAKKCNSVWKPKHTECP